jgi:hypothetical protein
MATKVDAANIPSEARAADAWRGCVEDALTFSAVGAAAGISTALLLFRKQHQYARGGLFGCGVGAGLGRAWERCNATFVSLENNSQK